MHVRSGVFSFFFLALLILPGWVSATHLRAGEITVERQSCTNLTFRITITVYTNTGSDIRFGEGILDFGDGTTPHITPTVQHVDRPDLGPFIGTVSYTTTHTYAGSGRYIISYLEPNRNAGILNMFNSVETRFYMESQINIDPFLGCDNSPKLLVPPIDGACTGAAWYHNPGAYDIDGDSLSYEPTIPKKEKDLEVDAYSEPNDRDFYDRVGIVYGQANEDGNGPPTYEIDPVTGTIVWDAPGAPGEYNIAFIIRSWRKIQGIWVNQGYVVRDMQIMVEDCDNERPELEVPPDICVEAGTIITEDIFGTDPDFDNVKIEVFSQIINPPFPSPATFVPANGTLQPTGPSLKAKLTFTWNTACIHVKDQPYQVVFKITDEPPPGSGAKLVQFKTWNIKVVGPKPTWADIEMQSSRSLKVTWDPYTCANAETMQVWRRVEGNPYTPLECETGMPESLGYNLIATTPIAETTFTDDNEGLGLAPATTYCYRLVALFPLPQGGESYVSIDTCFTIKADAPVITHANVDKTGTTDGQVTIRWRPPFEIDQVQFPPPYRYRVFRAEGLTGDIFLAPAHSGLLTDTTFTDVGLNTLELAYNYRVSLIDNTGDSVSMSAIASTVRLDPKPQFQRIELNWAANVPWSNQSVDYPYHYIYRGPEGATEAMMALIDSVTVTSGKFIYVDSGQFNDTPLSEEIIYCYRIQARGTYGHPRIISPLINFSQINCAQPNDSIPPCKLTVSVQGKQCSEMTPAELSAYLSGLECPSLLPRVYSNLLTWRRPDDLECRQDIRSYNIYAAPYIGAEFSLLVQNVRDTFYTDANLPSNARCYKVSAVDRAGNEGELSEQYCFDNCPRYTLPNVFTPNGDYCNDFFSAYSAQTTDESGNGPCGPVNTTEQRILCARFVEKVEFVVTNRWGKHVYDYQSGGEQSIYINWDGRDNNGNEVAAGVYYYNAKVTYTVVDPSKKTQNVRGWVQVVR